MDTSSGSVKLSCCEHYGNVLNEYSDPELKAVSSTVMKEFSLVLFCFLCCFHQIYDTIYGKTFEGKVSLLE